MEMQQEIALFSHKKVHRMPGNALHQVSLSYQPEAGFFQG
jgi:hypothetical protein